jgi:hypothetical protein
MMIMESVDISIVSSDSEIRREACTAVGFFWAKYHARYLSAQAAGSFAASSEKAQIGINTPPKHYLSRGLGTGKIVLVGASAVFCYCDMWPPLNVLRFHDVQCPIARPGNTATGPTAS